MTPGREPAAHRQRGVTLIELMVAIVIGLVVTLAATNLLIFGESSKRTSTATNDMGQTGAYAAYVLDRAVRGAGSGFTQSWNLAGAFGCRLSATLPATPNLPRGSAFPAPFATSFLGGASGSATLRVVPVLIGRSQSDAGSAVLAAPPRRATCRGSSCRPAHRATPCGWTAPWAWPRAILAW